jgi:hypothetical protein
MRQLQSACCMRGCLDAAAHGTAHAASSTTGLPHMYHMYTQYHMLLAAPLDCPISSTDHDSLSEQLLRSHQPDRGTNPSVCCQTHCLHHSAAAAPCDLPLHTQTSYPAKSLKLLPGAARVTLHPSTGTQLLASPYAPARQPVQWQPERRYHAHEQQSTGSQSNALVSINCRCSYAA